MRTMTIKIPNVPESLEEKLEAFILGGTFWPDQPLAAERRLAAEFDVSRTSLRNALASLQEKGLLTPLKRGYRVTNVLADLLQPCLANIAARDPNWLLDYWLLFLEEVVVLADRKAQNSDRVHIQKSVLTLRKCVEGQDAVAAASALDGLVRTLINACYNFFLSQTHYAWYMVAAPNVGEAMSQICAEPYNAKRALDAIDKVGTFDFSSRGFRDILAPGFKVKNAGCEVDEPGETDPKKLIDVILRHPVAIEEVYELRLISEKHAARQAASNLVLTPETGPI